MFLLRYFFLAQTIQTYSKLTKLNAFILFSFSFVNINMCTYAENHW